VSACMCVWVRMLRFSFQPTNPTTQSASLLATSVMCLFFVHLILPAPIPDNDPFRPTPHPFLCLLQFTRKRSTFVNLSTMVCCSSELYLAISPGRLASWRHVAIATRANLCLTKVVITDRNKAMHVTNICSLKILEYD